MAVEIFHVAHGTLFASEDNPAYSVERAICEASQPLIQAYWTVRKFLEKGFEVKSVAVKNFSVVDSPPRENVNYKHLAIEYDVEVEASPIAASAILAYAGGAAILIVAIAVAYTIVSPTAGGPGLLVILLLAALWLWKK